MTTFVITVPGTFTSDISDSERAALERELAPQHTDVSESEGVNLLTLNEDGTFAVRLEVEAADRYEAKLDATRLVSAALRRRESRKPTPRSRRRPSPASTAISDVPVRGRPGLQG